MIGRPPGWTVFSGGHTTQPAPKQTYDVHVTGLGSENHDRLDLLSLFLAEELAIPAWPPLVEWLLPDPRMRARYISRWVEMLTADALERGKVHVGLVDDLPRGVAVWGPGTRHPDHDRQLARAVGAFNLDRFQTFDRLVDSVRPDEPHHQMHLIVVDSRMRNDGFGRELLHRHHAILRREDVGGFTVATSPNVVRLLLRHHWTRRGKPLRLPGQQVKALWPMWRPPHSSRAQHS